MTSRRGTFRARVRLSGLLVLSAALAMAPRPAAAQTELYRSREFIVTDRAVEQGPFRATAASRDTILSSYPRAAREVRFRFSLNGQDNEFRPGTEHTIHVRPVRGALTTPVYVFGEEGPASAPSPASSVGGEEGQAAITIRLDMRRVLRELAARGSYRPPYGDTIARGQLTGVYVIGGTPPLSWDVSTLRPGSPLQLTDADGDSVYAVTLALDASYTRPLAADGRAVWARTVDVSAFPRLESPQPLLNALYDLSLEELQQNVRPDGALSAGAKWEGVWTRDVALSTVLSLAIVAPEAVRVSLLAKVDSAGRIIQDTGTGGSWPVSTDRTTWALAAWELYAATGDRRWLRTAYDVIRRSAEADLHAAFDRPSRLFRGESSFMDWREQSYPRWMQPADIYQSQSLSTNVVHHATYRILGDMARALGEATATRWDAVADTVRRGIDAGFWLPGEGWYGEYRYGRNHASLSPRAEGLGEALAIIYGVTSPAQAVRLARRAPVTSFGVPSFWPYIPGEKLYHNAAIWPFVTAYWSWASAEAGNTAGVEHGLASLIRPAALFLTNKENMVAATGHFEGTELTSDRQLWSVAGTLAATYRVLFGLRLDSERLRFRPMIPPAYGGERTLSGLRYRDALLTVTTRGFGTRVASARLDGKPLARPEIPATLAGTHRVELVMDGRWPAGAEHLVENLYTPAVPEVALRGDTLTWPAVPGAATYEVRLNGRVVGGTRATVWPARRVGGLAEYQVLARDARGLESFLSEPLRVTAASDVTTAEPTAELERGVTGYGGEGYVRMTREGNVQVTVPVRVARAGWHAIDARYANGGGPINTDSKAAIRTLRVDGRVVGVLVMPQRGAGAWNDWGYSNPLRVWLSAGRHELGVVYTPLDENMDRRENTALLDHLRITALAAGSERGARTRR